MAKTQFLESLSPENVLTVGLSYGDVISFLITPAAKVGGPIDTNTGVRNTGDTTARFHIEYIRWDSVIGGTYVHLIDSAEFDLAPNALIWIPMLGIDTMPNRDSVIYRAITWRDGTADDMADAVVELLTAVNTALTSAISPARIYKGGKYRHSGKLTRADTGVGIASASIFLERFEASWINVGNATTDANGNYVSGDIIAPSPATTPSTYAVRAHYIGSAIFGLGESFSSTSSLEFVMPIGVENVVVIGGLGLAMALVGHSMAKRNKSRNAAYASIAGLALGIGVQRYRGRI